MKLLRTFTMITLLCGVAHAEAPPAKSPAADKKPVPVADKKAPPTTPPPAVDKREEVSAADADKFLAFFNKIADAMVANKDDCTKLASSLNGLVDSNADLLKKANESKVSGKKLPKALEDKMNGRIKDMMPAMQKCQNDAGVQNALKRMDGKPADKTAAPADKTAAPPAKTEPKAPPAATKTPAAMKK